MAKKNKDAEVNLDESSVYGKDEDTPASDAGDAATETDVDRLEAITGGADDPIVDDDEELNDQMDALDASIDEELDALQVNLEQDDALDNTRDGSGRVIDEVAEEQIAKFTEVGPLQPNLGAVPVEPGRDDTSATLRRHHPNTEVARSEDVGEGNLDEPRDEEVNERKVDDGTAA
jgi:hypothetical protein